MEAIRQRIKANEQEIIRLKSSSHPNTSSFIGQKANDSDLCKNIIQAFQDQADQIETLRTENAKLRTEFKEVLTALTIKKPVGQEIAELQARIVELYSNESKEYHS